MSHLIKIPDIPKHLWPDFISINRVHALGREVDKVILDFKDCPFIEPLHIVSIACLIEEYHIQNIEIVFLNYEKAELKNYLSNINFFKYWGSNFNRNTYTPSKISTNLCLWKVDNSMISEYVRKAQEYFEVNYLDGLDVQPLNISLAELFNNINDHAGSKVSGYCISQFYPRNDTLKIAVCDFGKGIPNVVNDFLATVGRPQVSDEQAIEMAFEKAFSSKSTPQNRGFGLDTIKDIVLYCGSTMRVYSNKGAYKLSATETNVFPLKSNFEGTLYEIVLDTNKFEPKEDENFEADFEL